jgi:hypothetical protein
VLLGATLVFFKFPKKDEEKRVLAFVVRRRAEEAVRGRQALTGAIQGAALDAIITMDRSGRIMEFNRGPSGSSATRAMRSSVTTWPS